MFFAPQTILDKKRHIFDVTHDVKVKRHRGKSHVIMTKTCLLENSRKMASVSLTVYEILKKTMCSGSHRPSENAAGLSIKMFILGKYCCSKNRSQQPPGKLPIEPKIIETPTAPATPSFHVTSTPRTRFPSAFLSQQLLP